MRPVAVILVVVAVVSAGLAAYLAKTWLDTQSRAKAPAAVVETIDVLVVARDLPAGTMLSDGDLRYDSWPISVAAGRFVTRKPGEDVKAALIGQVSRRTLTEGEPFTQSATFKQDGSGILAGILGPGMRAVSVAITNASAVSGFVVPGDRVDVVMAADFQKSDNNGPKGGPIVRFAAETVLENVKILAIDQQIAKGKDGAAIPGKTATIEVTPKQAEVLITAGMVGQLSLVLRAMAKGAVEPAAGMVVRLPYTSDTEASKAMQSLAGQKGKPSGGGGSGVLINRAGDISTKSFSQ
jgi:pilus assembly protein CpaB